MTTQPDPQQHNLALASEASLNTTPVDGIEILVTMARNGKIDPWNIDIVEVTDQYLQILSSLKSQDLKLTGKTLLYAAILLRMKSDSMSGIDFLRFDDEDQSDLGDEDFLELGLESAPGPLETISKVFKSIDQLILRRTSVKQPRNRKVTLNDLISELKKYEELERKRRLKETVEKAERRRMRNYADFSAEDIVELAHEEAVEDNLQVLKNILEGFFLRDEAISLTQLVTVGKIDKISAYLTVLFLCAQGEVDLEQERFYTELYITPDKGPEVAVEPSDDEPLELAG